MFTALRTRLSHIWHVLTIFLILIFLLTVGSWYVEPIPGTAQGQPTPIPHHFPALSYRQGLEFPAAIEPTTDVAMGIFGGNYDNPAWSAQTNLLANEFDMVTVTPWFGTIRKCPPRWMVDQNAPRDLGKN